jgi:hypothetical protein
MRRQASSVAVLATAAVAALALAPSQAQEAAGLPAATVLVRDTTGAEHRLVSARLFAEAVGLLSVSLEPADEFQFKVGAAVVKVPVRLIRTIEFSGGDKPGAWTTVKVTDRQGQAVTGTPEKPDKAEIRGALHGARFAQMELKLHGVTRIDWEGPAPAIVCEKCRLPSQHPDWKFCPYDGQRYPKGDAK